MKLQTSRAIARNLVIAAAMGLTVLASWAVTGVRHPVIDIGTVSACPAGGADAGQRLCKTASQQG